MQDRLGVDQTPLDDAALIALFCRTQKEIEAHGETDKPNVLLLDFATELLKRHLSGDEASPVMEGSHPEVMDTGNGDFNWKSLASPFGAIAVINSKIVKGTQDLLTRQHRNGTDQWWRLGKVLLELPANFLDAVNGEVAKVREPLLSGLVPAKAHLRQTQDALARLGGNAVGKGQQLGKVLRELPANFLDAVNGKVAKVRGLLLSGLVPAKAHLGRARDMLTRLRKRADNSRNLRASEKDLRRLLANSPDAVVVTSTDRRLVEANPKGLSLFGISETNMTMFTLDVFFSRGQIPRFAENGASFTNRNERHGECKIRRLDGSLRVAEFAFIPNYVPFLHVFRFQNDRKWTPGKRLAA